MLQSQILKSLGLMSLQIKSLEDEVTGLVSWTNQSDILLIGLMKSMSNLLQESTGKNTDSKATEDI